jgi:hypothetical protein
MMPPPTVTEAFVFADPKRFSRESKKGQSNDNCLRPGLGQL